MTNEPEQGSPEWVELRRRQTREHGNETRRFQPHRADNKRTDVTRRKRPGIFWAVIGLYVLFSQVMDGTDGTYLGMDVGEGVGHVLGYVHILAASYLLVSWFNQMFLWIKEK